MLNVHKGFLTTTVSTLAVVLASIATAAQANPSGGTVVVGDATITQPSATTVAITQTTDRAVIDWRSFNIATGELTQFNQPNANSITLNRVTGGDPSSILGAIRANGQVWLINPNGIAFGQGAKVDVSGLLATTLNIDNADFMAGRYRFTDSGTAPTSVTNAGNLTISGVGLAALVAPIVANSGVIQAHLGHIDLAATHGFTLDFYGDGQISFLLNKDTSAALANSMGVQSVSNSGSLIADGGSVLLTADTAKSVIDQAINMEGYIQARTVGTAKGNIMLDGGQGAVSVAGTIDASGAKGGTIAVTGGAVELTSTARLDASGDTGGGTVLVGGDEHGAGALANAQITSVAAGAQIQVNALTSGDAGKAVVWSDARTDFAGTIDATGGSEGGSGGFAEVSGHDLLNFTGTVDLRAANGALGTLLLDPRNVTISATGGTAPTLPASGAVTLNPASDDSILQVSTLQTALGLGNVIVTTGSDGIQAGDITVASSVSWSNGSNLTLLANRNVILNDGVTIANTGTGNLALHADSTGSGTGSVVFNGTGRVDYSAGTGTVSIYYNSVGGYTSPTSYASNVTTNGAVINQLIAYMLVNDVSQLQAVSTNLTGNYALGRDIDASATATWNSGNGFNPITPFSGTLDGLGHAISNLKIDPNHFRTGLFGQIATGGVVKNLELRNAGISYTTLSAVENPLYLGLLAGQNDGIITSVSSSGSINISLDDAHVVAGGLVGGNTNTIQDSSSSSTVTSTVIIPETSSYGGLVGDNAGVINRSNSSGNVTNGAGGYAGGLVGNNGGTISYSFTTGSVAGTGTGFGLGAQGGIAGGNGGTINNSYSSATVYGSGVLGGIVALNFRTISQSYFVGRVNGNADSFYIGGLVGSMGANVNALGGLPSISESYVAGSVTSTSSTAAIGGLVGQSSGAVPADAIASNVFWDTQATTQANGVGSGPTGGIPLTTTQLKSGLPPGFDPTIWAIDPAVNNGYPYLKWQVAVNNTQTPQNVAFGVVAPPPPSLDDLLGLAGQLMGGGTHLPIYDAAGGAGAVNAQNQALFLQIVGLLSPSSYKIDQFGFVSPTAYTSYLQEQCVALVAAFSSVGGATSIWNTGVQLSAANLASIPLGTPIATFDKSGKYTQAHSAIFLQAAILNGVPGFYILDQYNTWETKKNPFGATLKQRSDINKYISAEIRFYPTAKLTGLKPSYGSYFTIVK